MLESANCGVKIGSDGNQESTPDLAQPFTFSHQCMRLLHVERLLSALHPWNEALLLSRLLRPCFQLARPRFASEFQVFDPHWMKYRIAALKRRFPFAPARVESDQTKTEALHGLHWCHAGPQGSNREHRFR